MHTELATLEEVQRQAGWDSSYERYRDFLADASRFITSATRRWFVPLRATYLFDARGQHINTYQLEVPNLDLLAIETLTNGDGSAISASSYVLRPSNIYPKSMIQLKESALSWTYSSSWEDAISVDGIWGYHDSYFQAWVDTNEVVEVGGILAADTTLTLTDVNARDSISRIRCQTFMLLKIDDEVLKITAIDTEANEITVLRGQLGTTAATHDADAVIYSWVVQQDISKMCVDLVVWMERHRQDSGETIQFLDGTVTSTNEVPSNIERSLKRYTRTRMKSL
jgi:hypothetical protein